MKYFIDSNNIEEVERWIDVLGNSFAGITTNNLMLKSREEREEFKKKNYELFDEMDIMIQVDNVEDVNSRKCIYKVPMIKENFSLISRLKNNQYKTAATACYDLIQINQAIELKCDYTMVYYAKNPYKNLLEDAVKLKKDTDSKIKLVAASIHTVDEVIRAIKSGVEYVTVRPDVLELLFNNRLAVQDAK